MVVILSGGNIDTTVLGRCLDRGLAADGRLVRLTVLVNDRPGGLKGLVEFLYEQRVRYKSVCVNSDNLVIHVYKPHVN